MTGGLTLAPSENGEGNHDEEAVSHDRAGAN